MITILKGDWIEQLSTLPDGSVNCCVTSPPYWGLRDYGVDGQLGLEKSPEEYVSKLVAGFREVRRVLRDDGTLWLNLGDSYAGGGNYRGIHSEDTLTSKQASNRGARGLSQELGAAGKEFGLEPKNLVGIPWRTAFALQADGWWLRCDIVWHKPNPMPESVLDRPTRSHEFIFLLAKSERYYYDSDAVREPYAEDSVSRYNYAMMGVAPQANQINGDVSRREREKSVRPPNPLGRNRRDVWTVNAEAFRDAHFATFPQDLIKPCILAGCPVGGTVIDPFFGSGTTGLVATELGRNCIGIELNPEYVKLAEQRTNVTPGLALA